jgi:hypothetical protein
MDPVTLAALIKGGGKLLGALGPAAANYFGAKKASDTLAQSTDEISANFEQLKKDMPQYGVGDAWNQYLAMSKQDPAADMQRQIAAEQEASSVGALKAGGAKALLGGLGASQRAAAQNRMGIEAASQARQQSALGKYAGVQQEMDMRNTMLGQNLEASEFEALRGAEAANRELMAGKQQAMGQLIGAGLGMFGQGMFAKLSGTTPDPSLASQKIGEMGLTIDPRQFKSVMSDDMLNAGQQVTGLPNTDSYSLDPFGSASNLPFTLPGDSRNGSITPGEFSHETNPIDMMKDGAKIGEMTGGEAILNPEQQKKAAKESPYFRKLMREFAMRNRK